MVNVGTYTVTYSVKETANYLGATKTISVVINPLKVSEPTVVGTYTYDGKEKTLVLEGLESYMTANITKATNAGVYEVEVTLSNKNHVWAAGSDGIIEWTINKGQAVINVDTTPIVVTYGDEINLPEAVSNFGTVKCIKPKMLNVGDYEVKYIVEETFNYKGATATVNVTINKLGVDEPTVKGEYVYTGSELTVKFVELPSYMRVVSGDKAIIVGNYEVKVVLDGNHEWNEGSDGIISWSVSKAKYDMSKVKFEDLTKTYNGTEYKIEISGDLPNGVSVSYENNTLINAGDTTAVAIFTGDSHNYEAIPNMEAQLVINKADVTLTCEDITVEYSVDYELNPVCSLVGATLTYEYYKGEDKLDAKPTASGSYTVKVIYAGDNNHNATSTTANIIIKDPNYTSLTIILADITKTYGEEYTVSPSVDDVRVNPNEDLVITYRNSKGVEVSKPTDVGVYTIIVTYPQNNTLFINGASTSATLIITKGQAEITLNAEDIVVTYGDTVTLPTATTNFGEVTCDTNAESLVNAGTYTITYKVEGTDNYEGATATVKVIINKLAVSEPTVKGSYTYTGEPIEAQFNLEGYMSVTDGNTGTNAGTYYATIELDDNHCWAEGLDGKVAWTIDKGQAVITVALTQIVVTYGDTVTIPTSSATCKAEVECDKTSTDFENANVGTYTITYKVEGTDNYDGTTTTVTVTINPKPVSEPTLAEKTYTYTGTKQQVELTGFVADYMQIKSESDYATKAGIHEVVITLDANHCWAEGSDGIIEWEILKADSNPENLTKKYFELEYFAEITIEAFRTLLEERNLSVSDYAKVLQSGDNVITAQFTQTENHNPIDVEITLTCTPVINGFEVVDSGRQIEGKDFDKGVLSVNMIYNDGSKVATTNFTATYDAGVVTVTITDEKYTLDDKEEKITLTTMAQPSVMIYAVYGAGGNSGAKYTHDFIILYNNSAEVVDLTGWSIQYASATSTATTTAASVELTGDISGYGFYTIVLSGGANGNQLSFAENCNLTSTVINLAGSNIQVYLTPTTTKVILADYKTANIVDMVGAGTANKHEGTVAPAPDKVNMIIRADYTDSNDNFADFKQVTLAGSESDFEFLNAGYRTYNEAKSEIDDQNIDFTNQSEEAEYTLPTTKYGVNIVWSAVDGEGNTLNGITIDGGNITITPVLGYEYIGKLIGKLENTDYEIQYNICISKFEKLAAPTVTLNHFTLSWTSVENAVSYNVYLGEELLIEETTNLSVDLYTNYLSKFNELKEYEFTVVAVHDPESQYRSSFPSEAVYLTFAGTELNTETTYMFKVAISHLTGEIYAINQNGGQGYLLYQPTFTAEDKAALEIGTIIYVSGEYKLYNGLPEILMSGYTITEDKTTITPITTLKNLDVKSVGYPIELENVTATSAYASNKVIVGDGDASITLYYKPAYYSGSDHSSIGEGYLVSFKGVVGYYNAAQVYFTEISSDVPVDVKLKETLDEVTFDSPYFVGDSVELPGAGTKHTSVELEYQLEVGTTAAEISNGILTFNEVADEVKITVTAALGNEKTSKVITIEVVAAGSIQSYSEKLQYTDTTTSINMSASVDNASLVGVTAGYLTITSAKNSASNEVGLNKDGTIRLYAKSSNGEGTSLTIAAADSSVTIKSITIEFGGTVGSFTVNGVASTKSVTEYAINGPSVVIQNTTTGSTTQVHIKSITVQYTVSNGTESEELTDAEKVALDKEALSVVSEAVENLDLPTTGENGSEITWTSSNETVISNTGVVTRQSTDTKVTLTAIISSGEANDTATFEVTVKAKVNELINQSFIGTAKGQTTAPDGWTISVGGTYANPFWQSFRSNNQYIQSGKFEEQTKVNVSFTYYLNNLGSSGNKSSKIKFEALDASGNIVDTVTSNELNSGSTGVSNSNTISATLSGPGIVSVKITFIKDGGGNIAFSEVVVTN